MQPLHRSRGFWFGFAGLVMLCGMWASTIFGGWTCYCSIYSYSSGRFSSERGAMRLEVYRDVTVPGSFAPSVRFAAHRTDMYGLHFAAPRLTVGKAHNPAYREAGVVIPYWLLIALYLPLAWLIIRWRERVRQRAGAAISPA